MMQNFVNIAERKFGVKGEKYETQAESSEETKGQHDCKGKKENQAMYNGSNWKNMDTVKYWGHEKDWK